MKTDVKKIFGSNVFNDAVMKERLPKAAYKKMKATIEAGAELVSLLKSMMHLLTHRVMEQHYFASLVKS